MAIVINKDALKVAGDNTPATSVVSDNEINGIKLPSENVTYNNPRIDNFIENTLSKSGKYMYNTTEKLYDLYSKYNTYLNPGNTQEELDKERAKNQSGIEQLGRSLAQIVENEVGIGTVLGFSDLFDVVANGIGEVAELLGGPEHVNDFQNRFSQILTEAQDKNKERLAIYREDPNKTFALNDSGWWYDNFVTVGTTLSLMIPSVSITKGVSALGKSARMARLDAKLSKITAADRALENAAKSGTKLGEKLRGLGQVTSTAFLSRTMEDWQEGREVYNSTLEDARTKLKNLTSEQRETLYKNNPEFLNSDNTPKSDEDIAKLIASTAGMHAFWKDYWMLLMDVPQYFALAPLWKGIPSKAVSPRLSIVEKNAQKAFVNNAGKLIEGEALTEAGKAVINGTGEGYVKNNLINRAKELLKNPINSFTTLELNEGIEEGFQGIQAEKGKELANMIFDPSISERSLSSYLTDPTIWEQALWGVLGGIAFRGFGTGLGNLSRKIEYGQQKKQLGDKFADNYFAKWALTDEKMREYEILNRNNIWNQFVDTMSLINEGKNPYKQTTKDTNGQTVYQTITEEEKEAYKSRALNEFLTDFTLNATEAGNFDSLKALVTSNEFKNTVKNSAIKNAFDDNFENILSNRILEVNSIYTDFLKEAMRYSDEGSGQVANIVARDATRHVLMTEDLQQRKNDIDAQLNESLGHTINNDAIEKTKATLFRDFVNKLSLERNQWYASYLTGEISKSAYNQYLKDYNKKLQIVSDWYNLNSSFENPLGNLNEVFNQTLQENTKLGDNEILEINKRIKNIFDTYKDLFNTAEGGLKSLTKQQKTLFNNSILLDKEIYEAQRAVPRTNQEYADLFEEYGKFIEKKAYDRFQSAIDNVKDYLKNADNPEEAYMNLLKQEEEVYDGSNADMEILKIGYENGILLDLDFRAEITKIVGDREEKKKEEEKVKDGGEEVTNKHKETAVKKSLPEEEPVEGDIKDEEPNKPVVPANKRKPIVDKIHETADNPEIYEEPAPKGYDPDEFNPNIDYGDEGYFNPEEEEIPQGPEEEEAEYNERLSAKEEEALIVRSKISKMFDKAFATTKDNKLKSLLISAIESKTKDSKEYQQLSNFIRIELENDEDLEDITDFDNAINESIYIAIVDLSSMKEDVGMDISNEEALLKDIKSKGITRRSRLMSATPGYTDTNSELLHEILKEYVQSLGQTLYSDVAYRINVVNFFNEYANRNNATYTELLQLYRFLVPYITNSFGNIRFTNINTFLKGFDVFMATSVRKYNKISNEMYGLTAATETYDKSNDTLSDENKQILKDISDGKIINPNITLEESKQVRSTLEIIYTDDKNNTHVLGYINKVRRLGTNGNALLKEDAKGFSFLFEETNGQIKSNFDDLFNYLNTAYANIISKNKSNRTNDYKILNLIENYVSGVTKLSPSDIKLILNNQYIKQLINIGNSLNSLERVSKTKWVDTEGGIRFPYNNIWDPTGRYITSSKIAISDEKQVDIILQNLQTILTNEKGIIDLSDINTKFAIYKRVYYENMKLVDSLQQSLNKNNTVNLKLQSLGSKVLNTTDTDADIKDILNRPEDKELTTVYVGYDKTVTDKGDTMEVPSWFDKGTINFIVDNNGQEPIVINGRDNTLLESGSTIVDDLRAELKKLFTDFLNNKNAQSYSKLTNSLVELLDQRRGAQIFEGIQVYETNGYICIRQKWHTDPKAKILTISKYKSAAARDAKKESPADMYMSYWTPKNKYARPAKSFRNLTNAEGKENINNKFIDAAIETIIANLKFKQSPFMFNNIHLAETQGNEYIYKENGKFTIEINGNKRTYDSVADFIIKENTMKTNVLRDKNGSFTTYNDFSKASFSATEISKVEERIQNTEQVDTRTFDEILYDSIKSGNQEFVNSVDLLKSVGINQDIIDMLMDTRAGFAIIPEQVKYDESINKYGEWNSKDNTIYIGKTLYNEQRPIILRKELIRTLIHERFHSLFHNPNINQTEINAIQDELLETFKVFVNTIENNANLNDEARNLKRWLEVTAFSPDSFNSKEEFVEEWLTESISQQAIASYLNTIPYKPAKVSEVKEENKTVLQKIIDAIIKFFAKLKGKIVTDEQLIADDTILAKHYLLLSKKVTKVSHTKQKGDEKRVTRKKKTTKPVEEVTQGTFDFSFDNSDSNVTENTIPINIPTVEDIKEEKETKETIPLTEENLKKQKQLRRLSGRTRRQIELPDSLDSSFHSVETANLTNEQIADEYRILNPTINPSDIAKVGNINTDYLNRFKESEKPKIANLLNDGEVEYLC